MGKITVFKGQQIWDYPTQDDRLIRCRLKQVGGYLSFFRWQFWLPWFWLNDTTRKSALILIFLEGNGKIGELKHCRFCFKDSILAKDCYSAEEQKRKFCPAVCCFAVYHDVPLPCSLPSLLQQGDVCNSFFIYTFLVRFFMNFFSFD